MQKIFYDGQVLTGLDEKPQEAFLVNDESVVFVGSKDEVFELKTDDTWLVDLKGKTVCPSFFYVAGSIFLEIEKRLKNAKKDNFIEKTSKNNENYDKFCNFDIYSAEFLKIQDELILKGIVTVQETNLNEISFTFFKKLSEQKLIKINIIGYVNILSSKDVMDNNCRSYRKYQNHFRLAGFSLCVDGSLFDRTALLSFPYRGSKGYFGMQNVFDEQLEYIIKTSIEEKRQLLLFASGDKAISQVIRCYEKMHKDGADTMRPVLVGAEMINKKHMKLASKFGFYYCVSNDFDKRKTVRKNIGFFKEKKFNNLKILNNNIVAIGKGSLTKTPQEEIFELNKINFQALNSATKIASIVCYEEMNLGTIENGKQASFVVLSDNPANAKNVEVIETYFAGEKI